MRIYNMDYKSYAEIRCLSLAAYRQIFRKGDIFKVVNGNGNGEIVTIKAF